MPVVTIHAKKRDGSEEPLWLLPLSSDTLSPFVCRPERGSGSSVRKPRSRHMPLHPRAGFQAGQKCEAADKIQQHGNLPSCCRWPPVQVVFLTLPHSQCAMDSLRPLPASHVEGVTCKRPTSALFTRRESKKSIRFCMRWHRAGNVAAPFVLSVQAASVHGERASCI